jgi:very-short-patch-repair endonuclease
MPFIPEALKGRPFTLAEARAAGVSDDALRGRAWRRLGPELYCLASLRFDTWQLLRALQPKVTAFAGRTAAWLHGIDVDPTPIEVIVPSNSGLRSRPGLEVHRTDELDFVSARGLRATPVARTFRDLKRRFMGVEFLVLADQAMNLGLGRHHHLAEPAQSPMETRLRWLLIQAGLPKPQVQVDLHNSAGRFVGRADLYYPNARLVIEYDGGNHRDRLVEDNQRQNLILNAGYRLLRFTAVDIHQRSHVVIAQVLEALGTAPPAAAVSG